MSEHFGYDDAATVRDRVLDAVDQEGLKGNIEDMVITGSGLGGFVDDEMMAHPVRLSMRDLLRRVGIVEEGGTPVLGHARELVVGQLKGDEEGPLVLAQNGREHPYEGVSMKRATFWLRVAQLLGVKTLVGSNASGVVTPDSLTPPDLMLVNSVQDYGVDNPLLGENDSRLGPRFPHMAGEYPASTRAIFQRVAQQMGIKLLEGMYFRVPGPHFERPEDVYHMRAQARRLWEEVPDWDRRFLLGQPTAVVGMSSTYEVMAAMHASQSTQHPAFNQGRAYLSVAANYAASLGPKGFVKPTIHEDVIRETNQVRAHCGKLVSGSIIEMRRERVAV